MHKPIRVSLSVRNKVVRLALTYRLGFKTLLGNDCKYSLVNIRSISHKTKLWILVLVGQFLDDR